MRAVFLLRYLCLKAGMLFPTLPAGARVGFEWGNFAQAGPSGTETNEE